MGDLNLSYSNYRASLPEGLHIGGNLNLACTRFTSLPNWITTMGPRADGSTRTINLTETEISDAIIDRLRETPTPGMQFHFGRGLLLLMKDPLMVLIVPFCFGEILLKDAP